MVLNPYCHHVPCFRRGTVLNREWVGQEVAVRLLHPLGHCSCLNQMEFFSSLKVWQTFFQAEGKLKASLAL